MKYFASFWIVYAAATYPGKRSRRISLQGITRRANPLALPFGRTTVSGLRCPSRVWPDRQVCVECASLPTQPPPLPMVSFPTFLFILLVGRLPLSSNLHLLHLKIELAPAASFPPQTVFFKRALGLLVLSLGLALQSLSLFSRKN